MKILLTGANGFLGKCLYSELEQQFEIISLSRRNSDITCDLSQDIPSLPLVDLVIHASGKAHEVPKTINEVNNFFNTNVTGTKNLLKGLEKLNTFPKYLVFISSVSVYGLQYGENISESTPLLASDPYGNSKIEAEKLIQNWCKDNNVIYTILRLPLLIGRNPKGNLFSMIEAIKSGIYFNIYKIDTKKSMVLVDDVSKFILKAAKIGGIYNLTDGINPTFRELSNIIAYQLGKKNPISLPLFLIKFLAYIGDFLGSNFLINSIKLNKMTSNLTFDDTNARKAFGWHPRSVLNNIKI